MRSLGADAKAREYKGTWWVQLTTDSIAAIRHPVWIEAVRALVEELYRRGAIDEEKRERLLREIDAGPDTVEIAGVEMSVKHERRKSSARVVVRYSPTSPEAFERAVKALKDAGFVEDVH